MQGLAEEPKRRRPSKDNEAPDAGDWLFHPGSAMSERIQNYDWAATALGPMSFWGGPLQMSVSIMLASYFPIALWLGEDLQLLYNDAYAPILGTKHPRALGKPGRETWYDIWSVIGALHANVWTSGKSTWAEDQGLISDRNGYQEEVYFTYSYSPIRSPSGKVIGTFNAAQETTTRFIAERRVETLRCVSTNASRATCPEDVMRECVSAVTPNGRDFPFVLFYLAGDNDKQKLVGQLRVASGAPLIADDFAGPVGQYIREVPLPPSLKFTTDVTVAPTSAFIVPLCQGSSSEMESNLLGVLIIGVNPYKKPDEACYTFLRLLSSTMCAALLTAREHARERRKAEQLAELDRMKTTFFHNISHELRTPLTLIIGPLDDVLKTALDNPQREAIECALRNSQRLLQLVNMLLDFARIEAGRERATYRPLDFSAMVTDLSSNFRSACMRGGLNLIVDCPPIAEYLYVDKDMIEKVVINLMSNAFKFTLRGSIQISLKRVDDFAVLTVSDSGCGIPATELPRIFDRFHRVTTAQGRSHEGSGIGLALVAEVARLHGGTVDVTSEVGVGSTFVVKIPFARSHLPADRVIDEPMVIDEYSKASPLGWLDGSHTASPRSVSSGGLQKVVKNRATAGSRILVADDNADMRGYLTRILTENGFVVFTAQDGVEALTKLCERTPEEPIDLVISDIMMPSLDGRGLLQAIRSSAGPIKDTPVVFLSARAGEEEIGEGVTLGADDYLVKPFYVRELITRVGARIELTRFRLAAAKREHDLREQAERASAAKDHFIAVLSHELRTPLTPALMIAEAGENDPSLPESVRKDMGIVASNIRLEVHLIADLLDITKIRQGKLELRLQTRVDMHALLHQTMSLLKENIRQRNHHIALSLECDPCYVTGDATRLQQVLWNVVGNAIKFTPNNGQIWVSTEQEGDELLLRVKDTGLGIEPANIPRLFSAFEQGSSDVTRQFGGLGLGLAITKQLVLLHHGTIDAISEGINKGVQFIIRLPLASSAQTLVKSAKSSSESVDPDVPSQKSPPRQLRVLIVEDNASTQVVLQRMLQRLGHHTQVTGSVKSAIAALEAAHFDAMLCDLGLSDGSGLDVIAIARTLQPRMYSAALTGYGTDDDINQTRAAGFLQHLVKPIRLVQLQEFITAACTHSK